jgi:hypothetical protein
MGLIRIADTRQNSTLDSRTKLIRDDFNLIERNAIFDFDDTGNAHWDIVPQKRGNEASEIIIPFRIPDIPYAPIVTESNSWNLSLNVTSLDLDNRTSGIIDGLARANRDYIMYAFLDENLKFAGMGLGQKPKTTFSAISGGTATKGTTATFTVVTAYRFTEGARVVVRNTNGTYYNDYQFNWGIVNTIISDTSISIDMENDTLYGVNITSVTGGEIEQWDKFRPWVVTTTSQTLFAPYYTVIGEMYAGGQNKAFQLYKKTDTIRQAGVVPEIVFSSASSGVSGFLYLARVLPLWAKTWSTRISVAAGSNNTATSIVDSSGGLMFWVIATRDTSITTNYYNPGFIPLDRKARSRILKTNVNNVIIILIHYTLPAGGMYV